jgi:hypothetical protein
MKLKNTKRSKMSTIQIKFTESAHSELEKLKNSTGASSYTELFKNALALFRWAVEQKQSGNRIISISDDQNAKGIEVILPII